MKRLLAIGFGLVAVGVLLGGCSEAVSSTAVSADGSVVKVITIREGSGTAATNFGGEEPKPMADMIKLEGEGWTVNEDTVNGARVLVAEKRVSHWREADSGWSLVISDKKSIVCRSHISESDGYFSFEEKYSYVGPIDPAKREKELALMRTKLKENWLKGSLSDKDAEELSVKLRALVVQVIFGPSEPILPIMLTSPKRFEREFKVQTFGQIAGYFVGINGMDLDLAKEQAKKFLEVMDAASQVENPAENPEPEGDEEESGNENSYSISVSFRGSVVKEQNGLVDPITDEIYWDFYSMAVEEAPVVLRVGFRN